RSLHNIALILDLDGSFTRLKFAPLEPIGSQDQRHQRIALRLAGGRIKSSRYPCGFFLRSPVFPQIASEPVFGAREIGDAGASFAYLHRHVELARHMLGVLVEVARAKQMAAARFNVIGFHARRAASGFIGICSHKRKKQSQYYRLQFHKPCLLGRTRAKLCSRDRTMSNPAALASSFQFLLPSISLSW